MAISGLIAGGVQGALDEVQERRLKELVRQLQERQAADQLALQTRQVEGIEADRAANRDNQRRTIDLASLKRTDDLAKEATEKNARSDMANVLNMPGMAPEAVNREIAGSSMRTGVDVPRTVLDLIKVPEVKRHAVTTTGPGGKPLRKLVTEDELAGGIEEYREPRQGPQPEFEWVIRGEKPMQIRKGTAQPGDKPYDAVAERKQPGDTGPSAYSLERSARTIQSVDELMGKVNRWTTGVGSLLANLPETEARNFDAELNTLKANIAFNELTAMREASKTGGALGQVSNIELKLLESALGALDSGQKPENIKAQLQKIKESVQRWQTAGGKPTMKPATSRDDASSRVDELLKKYGGGGG